MGIPGVKVLHEPFGGPHYFGPERASKRFFEQTVDASETFDAVLSRLRRPYDGSAVTFSKDMAYYMRDRQDALMALVRDPLVTHTFLIRHPARTVPSLFAKSHGGVDGTVHKATGWNHFDGSEVGFPELLDIYRKVLNRTKKAPVVVDADDLLSKPEEVLKKYCACAHLSYTDGMTSWAPGPVDEWATWSGWHDDAMNSSGLIPRKLKPLPTEAELNREPEEVRRFVRSNLLAYSELARHVLK